MTVEACAESRARGCVGQAYRPHGSDKRGSVNCGSPPPGAAWSGHDRRGAALVGALAERDERRRLREGEIDLDRLPARGRGAARDAYYAAPTVPGTAGDQGRRRNRTTAAIACTLSGREPDAAEHSDHATRADPCEHAGGIQDPFEELFETGRPIEAPVDRGARKEWGVDLEDDTGRRIPAAAGESRADDFLGHPPARCGGAPAGRPGVVRGRERGVRGGVLRREGDVSGRNGRMARAVALSDGARTTPRGGGGAAGAADCSRGDARQRGVAPGVKAPGEIAPTRRKLQSVRAEPRGLRGWPFRSPTRAVAGGEVDPDPSAARDGAFAAVLALGGGDDAFRYG